MTIHYKNNWRHTCAFMLTLATGSYDEPKDKAGYTHLGEHLMFSGTQKLSHFNLQEKSYRVLNMLEATTSREETKIFCYFSLEDFNEAIEILEQMVFDWRCRQADFKEAKEDLLSETTNYFSSAEYRKRREVYKLLPLSNKEPISSLSNIKKITYHEVPAIKSYWQDLLRDKDRYITIIGGNISKQHLLKIEKIFDTNKSVPAKQTEWNPNKTKIVNNAKAYVFWYQDNRFHLYSLFLDRIFYWRWQKNQILDFEYDSVAIANTNAFIAYSESGLKNRAEIDNFFRQAVSQPEFEYAKRQFLIYFQQTLDVIEWADSLDWFNGFASRKYFGLQTSTPQKVYEFFKNMKYEDFQKFLGSIKNNL